MATNASAEKVGNTDPKKAPVTVTRGLNTGFFSQKIDWLEGTFKKGKPISLPTILSQNFVEAKAFNGYTTASLYSDKRVLMSNVDRPDMGNHLTWNGEACGFCPMLPEELTNHLFRAGFSFTRIDFALDFINCNLDPAQATEEIKNGRVKTRAKQFPFWADAKGEGYTQYMGKKASEVYVRIYDKAAEMGINQDHTRVELVTRHSRADHAAFAVSFGADFRGMVLSFVNFEKWREWNEAMDVPKIKLPKEQRVGNTEKWLLDACAPALARTIFLAGNSEFYERFKATVTANLEQLSNNRQAEH